jgi:hypothetical protein
MDGFVSDDIDPVSLVSGKSDRKRNNQNCAGIDIVHRDRFP